MGYSARFSQPWAADLLKPQNRAAEGRLERPGRSVHAARPAAGPASIRNRSRSVQTSTQILILLRVELRPADPSWTAARSHRSAGRSRSWHGYSVGRWDGDTLVVDSNNFHGVNPAAFRGVEPKSSYGVGWLDHRGSPYTEAMTLTERFQRVDYGHLNIDMTVNDPKAYSKPFTLRIGGSGSFADGSEPIEFICHENQMFLKLTGRAPR